METEGDPDPNLKELLSRVSPQNYHIGKEALRLYHQETTTENFEKYLNSHEELKGPKKEETGRHDRTLSALLGTIQFRLAQKEGLVPILQ